MSTIVDLRQRRDEACLARLPSHENKSTAPSKDEACAEIILFPRVKKRAQKSQHVRKALKRRFTLRA